ncbi:class I SAM-dependent DNA methyltransferase [Micrococcus luteus]|uniref:type I restriction-modification system subunit M n=1 Tax=Micrococcus luteus TaxID=1270 RepID=UPI00352BEFB4
MSQTRQATNELIWRTADAYLRGVVEPQEYGDYILPFTVLRRLECQLAPTKDQVLQALKDTTMSPDLLENWVGVQFGLPFYNSSKLDLRKIASVDDKVYASLEDYLDGFSPAVADLWESFKFLEKARHLQKGGVLFQVIQHFASIDLSDEAVPDMMMGDLFEDLMYRAFSRKGKGAGEFYTPRDAIRMMVDILFNSDDKGLTNPHEIRSIYDPTAGTGGMLLVAKKALEAMNSDIEVSLHGQESMASSYAIGKADLMIQGGEPDSLRYGDTLANDLYEDRRFDYILANPPFGGDWSKSKPAVDAEAKIPGSRFSHGVPGKSDGQMLFLSHVAHKLTPAGEGGAGGRACVVTNGSPMFSDVAGTGSIRQWLLTSDLVDAIIALPTSMFYGTNIATFVWVLDVNKEPRRKGFIQLIDATDRFSPMRKAMGEKRREISDEDRRAIVRDYHEFQDSETSRILTAEDFCYRDVVVTRPRRLAVSVTDETLAAALDHAAATPAHRQVVEAMDGRSWGELPDALKAEAKRAGVKMPIGLIDHIAAAVAVDDPDAPPAIDRKGKPVTDGWSMVERVPFTQDVTEHFQAEVLPFAPDVTWDEAGAKIGYEIPFTRIFYKPAETRPLEEIDADVQAVMADLMRRFQEVKA